MRKLSINRTTGRIFLWAQAGSGTGTTTAFSESAGFNKEKY
jgi:hypothetical protein